MTRDDRDRQGDGDDSEMRSTPDEMSGSSGRGGAMRGSGAGREGDDMDSMRDDHTSRRDRGGMDDSDRDIGSSGHSKR
jgi:hypothetical protein